MIVLYFFFFNDTATTEIYTLSLHDALPIWHPPRRRDGHELGRQRQREGQDDLVRAGAGVARLGAEPLVGDGGHEEDRKSTRLNSSHANISYAVFCLKKKKTKANFRLYFTVT